MTISKKATYALLADNVYWDVRKGGVLPKEQAQSNWTPVPNGWKVIAEVTGSGEGRTNNPNLGGFTARVYQSDSEIVIAYAGTDDADKLGDVLNDAQMGIGIKSQQALEAAILYQQIKHENPNAQITFTGHSLGGGLAGLMGILFHEKSVIFDHAPFQYAA